MDLCSKYCDPVSKHNKCSDLCSSLMCHSKYTNLLKYFNELIQKPDQNKLEKIYLHV